MLDMEELYDFFEEQLLGKQSWPRGLYAPRLSYALTDLMLDLVSRARTTRGHNYEPHTPTDSADMREMKTLDDTIRMFAQLFDQHPSYRKEWRP